MSAAKSQLTRDQLDEFGVRDWIRIRQGRGAAAHPLGVVYRVEPDAPGYMVELERLYQAKRVERLMVESAMRHEGSNDHRGTVDHAPSSVRATEVRVTARQRVKANDGTRHGSDLELLNDAAAIRQPRVEAWVSYRVPSWVTAAFTGIRLDDGSTALSAILSHVQGIEQQREREPRQGRQAAAQHSRQAATAAAQRAAVTAASSGRFGHDYTTH